MKFLRSNRKRLFIFLAVCITVMALTYIRTFSAVPGQITLLEGQEYVYDFKSPFMVRVEADNEGVVKLNNEDAKLKGSYLKLSTPVSFKSNKNGRVNLNLRVFGIIPLKTVQVDVVPNKKVVACGNTVGVKLRINGILVIGLSDVVTGDGRRVIPAKECGIKPGDYILEANKTKMKSIEDLVKQVDVCRGEKIELKVKRGNSIREVSVTPVLSDDDEKYHIGLWVRDSTAGIGTLTFYDPDSKSFAALGHGITDIDTGALMPVDNGEILESNIVTIKKGKQGSPGELKGVFLDEKEGLGALNKNCEYGIYGILNDDAVNRISNKVYPIALKNQVHTGRATILANTGGKSVDEYDIEIQKVSKRSTNGLKGMVIKVTDKRLLNSTGGIVQGMSGSPIIQDGKLVGAVTHVLVNDPTRGYGVFIEWMIKNLIGNEGQNQKKAA